MIKCSKQSLSRARNKNLVLDVRSKEIKEAGGVLSLARALLVIVGDLGEATVKSFWPHPYYHAFCEHRKRSVQATLSRLHKQGIIDKKKGDGIFFVLTKSGEKERNNALHRIVLEKEKSAEWDGKWRVLIFDIPEKEKAYG